MIKLITIITKFIIATLIALLFASCNFFVNSNSRIKGNGNITTENRSVSQYFKSIEVKNGIKVIVEQSDNKSITVETDENLQKNIITKVENGVLIIESDKSYNSEETPVVRVELPIIKGLAASSGSEITSKGTLITDDINVKSSSGSAISIKVEADAITVESSSGSTIEVNGKALKLETSASSGSEINTKTLLTNEVISKTSSGSSTSVYPIVKLEAKASSGSSINYYTTPKILTKEESSGGSINQE
ncbi:head GIN domain-containing protein [Flavobacterium cellulosilyticum]|uniref:DUF2807 domain-containing protein n=1 Tax=Flavobacterium cellulosilyticum TaxID=2541731 RepID=A0A4R5CIT4_9FLAO|nr:head GIN domain-containing protein [Flavobacterium cellulosilyticum]TDD97282.1 DUF2807 domain-containing protein [Flavobacterium cellulosilyticum]